MRKKRKISQDIKKASFILIITFLFVLGTFDHSTVKAQSTILCVNPATITSKVGGNFTVSVDVADVADLTGYNIYVRYNTTVLTATKIMVEGTWFTTTGITYTVWDRSIDEVKGIVHVSLTLTGVEEGVSGSGDLVHIDFVIDAFGSSALDIYNEALIDPLFDAIPHSTIDGIVKVTILGDLDGDGYVGPIDLNMFASAYGKRVGDALYNRLADLDGDGYIGPIDLNIFAANYGKTAR